MMQNMAMGALASVLKTMGVDADKLMGVVNQTAAVAFEAKAQLQRIEDRQTRIERKLDFLCASLVGNSPLPADLTAPLALPNPPSSGNENAKPLPVSGA